MREKKIDGDKGIGDVCEDRIIMLDMDGRREQAMDWTSKNCKTMLQQTNLKVAVGEHEKIFIYSSSI